MGNNRGKSAGAGMEMLQTYKQRGEWVELLFMARVARLGFLVSKPWGDSGRYDVGIERNGRFKRVQVKGTDRHEGNSYCCLLANRGRTYTAKEIDYFAIYILEEEIWYIFPSRRLAGQGSVTLSPANEESLHWAYKEAWGVLDGRRNARSGAAGQPRAAVPT